MHKIKVRKINKNVKFIIILCIVILLVPIAVTLSRYVYNKILDFYYYTQNFYFESDKLSFMGSNYSLDYWNGVDPYDIVINLNSYKNNSLKSSSDIEYKVSYECPNEVTCGISKENGIIYSSINNDSFNFTITPNDTFTDGDSVTVKITASSLSPYKKTLSASFKLVVGKYGLSHEIIDSEGSVYLEVKVTNSLESYVVKSSFDNYNIGDEISIDTYNNLSDDNKSKCVSASITLSFDPNVVYLNNNSSTFLKGYNVVSEKINNFDYVNKFTFDIDASSSSSVKLYKKNPSKDYSTKGDGIVKVNYNF